MQFFKNILTTKHPPLDKEQKIMITNMYQPTSMYRVSEDLTRSATHQELKSIMDSFGPLKTPGPDGFPAIFYQKVWELVKEDLLIRKTIS